MSKVHGLLKKHYSAYSVSNPGDLVVNIIKKGSNARVRTSRDRVRYQNVEH